MKKHFLLLIMAFMSLAGYAQIDISEATAGAAAIQYGDTKLKTITVRLDGTVEPENYVVDTKFYKDATLTEVVKVGEGAAAVDATVSTLPAGKHFIKITGKEENGYTGTKAIELTVNKAPLHLTIPTQHTVYGTPFTVTSTIEYKHSTDDAYKDELKNGEELKDAVKGTITAVLCTQTDANKTYEGKDFSPAVESYDVTFEGLTSQNYELTCTGVMDIWQKNIVDGGKLAGGIAITATDNTVTYNKKAQSPKFTLSLNGTALTAAEFTKNFTATTTGDATNVGTAQFTIGAIANKNFAGTYTGTKDNKDFDTYTLTINPAVAIVKAKDQTRVFDGTETKATAALGLDADQFEWTGIFEGDKITGTPVANVHADIKNAGETTIDLSEPASPGFGGDDNYTIGFDNTGKYEVTKRPLTITADDKKVGFGEEAPALTAKITGYAWADATDKDGKAAAAAELAELQKGVSAQFVDGFVFAEKAAGEYKDAIEPVVDATKAAATFANYTWEKTLVKGKLTIGAAQILIAIKAAKKTYGDPDPEDLANSVTVTGATAGLLTAPTVKRAPGEDAGTYKMEIDQKATAKDGYEILYTSTPVNFTIERAELTITALTQIMPSKTDVTAATAALDQTAVTIKGLKGSDTKANIVYQLAVTDGTNVADAGTKAGMIVVTAPTEPTTEGAKNKNYDIKVAAGDLVISGGSDLATITLPADATLMDILNYNDGVKVNAKVEFTRDQTVGGKAHTWGAEKWNTLVLPFDIKVSELSKKLGYAIVNVVDSKNTTEKNVMFKLKMSGTIEANTPFVVKTEDAIADVVDANGCIQFDGVTIKKPASEYPSVDAGMGYKFVGAYATKAVNKDLSYLRWLFGDGDKWQYVKSTSSAVWNIVPFAGYIDLGEANVSSAPEITFTMEEIDGTKTAIKAIDAETVSSNIDNRTGWYTIGGMKLQSAPTQKGIYINNGKKVVVK